MALRAKNLADIERHLSTRVHLPMVRDLLRKQGALVRVFRRKVVNVASPSSDSTVDGSADWLSEAARSVYGAHAGIAQPRPSEPDPTLPDPERYTETEGVALYDAKLRDQSKFPFDQDLAARIEDGDISHDSTNLTIVEARVLINAAAFEAADTLFASDFTDHYCYTLDPLQVGDSFFYRRLDAARKGYTVTSCENIGNTQDVLYRFKIAAATDV